jgi:hypothetical protein
MHRMTGAALSSRSGGDNATSFLERVAIRFSDLSNNPLANRCRSTTRSYDRSIGP